MSVLPPLPTSFNLTIANNSDTLCTLQICPLTLAHIDYLPNLAGNLLYTVIFGLALIAQVAMTIRYKIWGFGCAAFMGLLLEILGYAARIQMRSNPFIKGPFLQYGSALSGQSLANFIAGISYALQLGLLSCQQQSISASHASLSPIRKKSLGSDLQHIHGCSSPVTSLLCCFRPLEEL